MRIHCKIGIALAVSLISVSANGDLRMSSNIIFQDVIGIDVDSAKGKALDDSGAEIAPVGHNRTDVYGSQESQWIERLALMPQEENQLKEFAALPLMEKFDQIYIWGYCGGYLQGMRNQPYSPQAIFRVVLKISTEGYESKLCATDNHVFEGRTKVHTYE